MTQPNRRWARGACAAMLFNGLCASSGSLVLALLRERYALSYDLSGLLLALLSAGNMLAGFLSGLLPGRVGMRASALALGSGAALGYALLTAGGRPAVLLAGFALVGVAKGCALNNATVLISRAAPGQTRGMNLIHACFATGSLLCPLFLGLFSRGDLPWYAPLAALAAAGAGLWLSFALAGLPAGPEPVRRQDGGWGFLRARGFWYITGLLFCQNCSEISVTGWMVTYFQDTGILTRPLSQLTVTIVWGATLAVRLLIAFALPIRNNFRALAGMSAGTMAAYLLLLRARSGPAALALLFVFGCAIAGINPTAVASAGRMLSNASVGVMLPAASLGAVLMPYITGAVAQRAGLRGGMLCTSAAMAGMLVFSLLCGREERRQAARR